MNKTIPARKDVPAKDKWDLSSIFKSDSEWEEALKQLPSLNKKVLEYKGRLGSGPDTLLDALNQYKSALLQMECVYHYASLQHEADEDDTTATDRYGRAMMAYTQQSADLSFIDPELMTIEEATLQDWSNRQDFADYKIYLQKLLHFKRYTLSEKEERILSLQGQPAQTAETAFSVLTNIETCALREVEEETGLHDLQLGALLCITHHTYQLFGQKILKHTYWYAMTDEREESLIPQQEEDISRAEWVEKERLPEYLEGTYPSIVEVFVSAGLL